MLERDTILHVSKAALGSGNICKFWALISCKNGSNCKYYHSADILHFATPSMRSSNCVHINNDDGLELSMVNEDAQSEGVKRDAATYFFDRGSGICQNESKQEEEDGPERIRSHQDRHNVSAGNRGTGVLVDDGFDAFGSATKDNINNVQIAKPLSTASSIASQHVMNMNKRTVWDGSRVSDDRSPLPFASCASGSKSTLSSTMQKTAAIFGSNLRDCQGVFSNSERPFNNRYLATGTPTGGIAVTSSSSSSSRSYASFTPNTTSSSISASTSSSSSSSSSSRYKMASSAFDIYSEQKRKREGAVVGGKPTSDIITWDQTAELLYDFAIAHGGFFLACDMSKFYARHKKYRNIKAVLNSGTKSFVNKYPHLLKFDGKNGGRIIAKKRGRDGGSGDGSDSEDGDSDDDMEGCGLPMGRRVAPRVDLEGRDGDKDMTATASTTATARSASSAPTANTSTADTAAASAATATVSIVPIDEPTDMRTHIGHHVSSRSVNEASSDGRSRWNSGSSSSYASSSSSSSGSCSGYGGSSGNNGSSGSSSHIRNSSDDFRSRSYDGRESNNHDSRNSIGINDNRVMDRIDVDGHYDDIVVTGARSVVATADAAAAIRPPIVAHITAAGTPAAATDSSDQSVNTTVGSHQLTIDFEAAWRVIHTPLKVADTDGLRNKLLEIGITEAADLEDLEPEEVDVLANYLLVLPRRQFRKYLGL